jgi:hypothetical protein
MNFREITSYIKTAKEIRLTVKITADGSVSVKITKAQATELVAGLQGEEFNAAYGTKHNILWIG